MPPRPHASLSIGDWRAASIANRNGPAVHFPLVSATRSGRRLSSLRTFRLGPPVRERERAGMIASLAQHASEFVGLGGWLARSVAAEVLHYCTSWFNIMHGGMSMSVLVLVSVWSGRPFRGSWHVMSG
jgi:hypothetical protein